MLSNSFKSTKETLVDASHLLPKEPTVDGYRKVLTDSPFFYWLRNSLIITVSDTVIILFFPIPHKSRETILKQIMQRDMPIRVFVPFIDFL